MKDPQWQMFSGEFGSIALIARDEKLIRVCYKCSPAEIVASVERLHPGAEQLSTELIEEGFRQLAEYFSGHRRRFDLPLECESLSPFASNVHKELLKVPYGSVVSYGELATLAGSPRAARAVGSVMASNPLPLIVPCHRVVNSGGRIGQYSAARGRETKAWLIDFERSSASA